MALHNALTWFSFVVLDAHQQDSLSRLSRVVLSSQTGQHVPFYSWSFSSITPRLFLGYVLFSSSLRLLVGTRKNCI